MTEQTSTRQTSTRERLLDAAVELLIEGGYDAVTTRSVTARAGVNGALVNYYFGTKQRLLVEAAAAAMMRAFAEPAELLLESEDPRQGIGATVEWLARMDPRTPEMSVVSESTVRALRDPDMRRAVAGELAEFRAAFGTRLEAAIAEGRVRAGPGAGGLAILLAAALDGLALHVLLDPKLDLGAANQALQELLAPARVRRQAAAERPATRRKRRRGPG